MGGGNWCLFVIIRPGQAPSRSIIFRARRISKPFQAEFALGPLLALFNHQLASPIGDERKGN
jgi:hypothetical protein